MLNHSRKKLFVVAAGLAALLSGSNAFAQPYPARSITFVVPYVAGGTTDAAARLIAERMSRTLGAPIVIDNKPGASGIIATDHVAKARPDGYTLLVAGSTAFSTNPLLYKNIPYKREDLAPVGMIVRLPYVLNVANRVPAKNPAEFVRWAASRSEGVTYSTIGNGSANHLLGILIAQQAKVKMVDVPYKGGVPAQVDLIAGLIDAQVGDLNTSLPQHRAGKFRTIGIFDSDRWPGLDVPTFVESGFPEIVGGSYLALTAPFGTPSDIMNKLSEALKAAMSDPRIRENLQDRGYVPMAMTQAETARFMQVDFERWSKVIKSANIKLD